MGLDIIQCRPACAACCIVISISSPLPGMPNGKPAGIPCVNLDELQRCKIYDSIDYPLVCRNHKASPEFCGETKEEAMERLGELERLTQNDDLHLRQSLIVLLGSKEL